MRQERCGNGHIYDADIYGRTCPYCAHPGNTINFTADGEYHFKSSAAERIYPRTEPDRTVPPRGYAGEQEEMKRTVGVFNKKYGNEPVVGWLVCIKGTDIGKDFRLTAKAKTIGRAVNMDVCIRGDDTVSKDNHARIDYDYRNNRFYLLHGSNTNTIYLNNEPVYAPQLLKPYDVMSFGQTEFIFVPLCSDRFVWPK